MHNQVIECKNLLRYMQETHLKKVASITTAHGLLGCVRLRCFLDSYLSLLECSPLTDGSVDYHIDGIKLCGKKIIAKISHINSRSEAELSRNIDLLTNKDKLPILEEGEYFANDLINMQVILQDNTNYGVIKQFYNFGAGEIVEITLQNSTKTSLLPFNKAYFPLINKDNSTATLVLPDII